MKKNKVLISGGASGIGLAIAKKSLTEGFAPILIGRDLKKLKKAALALDCDFIQADLSKPIKLKNMTDLIGLVNNAGAYKPSSFKDSDFENWTFHIQANLMTAVNLTQAALPFLKKNKGSIVNISSTLGVRPIANTAAYSASKAAINNLSMSLAIELAPEINVNCICPGIVNTPIHDFQRKSVNKWKKDLKPMQPMNRVGEPEDIANHVVHFLKPENKWCTGNILNVDGGILLNS